MRSPPCSCSCPSPPISSSPCPCSQNRPKDPFFICHSAELRKQVLLPCHSSVRIRAVHRPSGKGRAAMFARTPRLRLSPLGRRPHASLAPTPVNARPKLVLTRRSTTPQLALTPEGAFSRVALSCVVQARLTCVCACTPLSLYLRFPVPLIPDEPPPDRVVVTELEQQCRLKIAPAPHSLAGRPLAGEERRRGRRPK
jgi:hypothetical protein